MIGIKQKPHLSDGTSFIAKVSCPERYASHISGPEYNATASCFGFHSRSERKRTVLKEAKPIWQLTSNSPSPPKKSEISEVIVQFMMRMKIGWAGQEEASKVFLTWSPTEAVNFLFEENDRLRQRRTRQDAEGIGSQNSNNKRPVLFTDFTSNMQNALFSKNRKIFAVIRHRKEI